MKVVSPARGRDLEQRLPTPFRSLRSYFNHLWRTRWEIDDNITEKSASIVGMTYLFLADGAL